MSTQQRAIFISDLHLDESHPTSTTVFITFLDELKTGTDTLYILGDLFEAWIGDDDATTFNQKIVRALRGVSQRNIPIYILRGNRDFLLGDTFAKQTGAIFLKDETVIDVFGQQVLLMHGDALCTDDHAFMRARKIMYNSFLQKIFLFLPLSLRRQVANKMRAKSVKHTMQAKQYIMDVNQADVSNVMMTHQVTTLIHGHTHRGNVNRFTINERAHKRIVLNAWHDSGSAYFWQVGEQEGKLQEIE